MLNGQKESHFLFVSKIDINIFLNMNYKFLVIFFAVCKGFQFIYRNFPSDYFFLGHFKQMLSHDEQLTFLGA